MKFMKRILLAILLLISAAPLSAQWTNLSIATGNDITHCSFPSNDTGYSTSGKIYRTFNGGISFDSVSVPGLSTLEDLNFLTNTDGVVCGNLTAGGPGIFRTLNAGLTWQNISAVNAVGAAMHVKFADALHGIFLTSNYIFYKTADGGVTWDTASFGYDYYNAIDFPTATTGYLGGFDGTFNYKGIILKTVDGGNTWTQATNFIDNYTVIQQLQFVNADTGFASYTPYMYPSHLLRTRDGAASWDTVLFTHGSIVRFAFRDYMNGFIVNDSGSIYRTFDAGVNWIPDRAHTDYLADINVTSNYVYSVGSNGLFLKRDLFSGLNCYCIPDFNLQLYPNPANEKISVMLPHGTIVNSISIMDMMGRNCGITTFNSDGNDQISIDTRNLSDGNYILMIYSKDEILHQKFVKAD
jgi:photosystem II stability/assembly factor-like uncharacterized protein